MTCAVGGAYHAESTEEGDDQKRSVTRFTKEIRIRILTPDKRSQALDI